MLSSPSVAKASAISSSTPLPNRRGSRYIRSVNQASSTAPTAKANIRQSYRRGMRKCGCAEDRRRCTPGLTVSETVDEILTRAEPLTR
ncbi:hypothetical protein GCM10027167_21630 [Nocardia heshunensis]